MHGTGHAIERGGEACERTFGRRIVHTGQHDHAAGAFDECADGRPVAGTRYQIAFAVPI